MYLMRYDKEVLENYILGESINGFDIHKLENNEDFMREVIVYSNNPKLYYFCSEKLKMNSNFVLFIIEKFINNYQAIDDIILDYFKNIRDDIKRKEFEIGLSELSIKYNDYHLKKYCILVNNVYNLEMNEFKKIINRITKNNYGIGFYLVIDRYSESKTIMNFFAKELLDDILVDYSLESELHKNFEKPELVVKYGINSFILSVIRTIDEYLANYLSTDISLMNETVDKINFYIDRWDEYDNQMEEKLINKKSLKLSFKKNI